MHDVLVGRIVCVAKVLVWGKIGSSKYKFVFFRAMYC